MTDLFNHSEAQRLKEEGMALAADAQADLLTLARAIAVEEAMKHPRRHCHADMVGRELKRRGLPSSLGHAAGSIFRGDEWEWTGLRIQSQRTTNHGRELKVWRYVG